MKKLLAAVVVVSLAGLTGCPEHKSGSGGAGPSPGAPSAGKFKITQQNPKGTVDLTQGEGIAVTLGIDRHSNFNGDVDVDAKLAAGPSGVSQDDIPKQLKLELDPHTFPGSKKDATVALKITAAPDAKLGDYGIQVTGHPKDVAGTPTEKPLEIKVHIKPKAENKPPKG
jgi:hypothetical protein